MVHLLTTATLDRLRDLYPPGRFEVRRFRPNIVISLSDGLSGFIEDAWIGRTLCIGDEVRLAITGPCPRCVMTTLAQADLPQDAGILRASTQQTSSTSGCMRLSCVAAAFTAAIQSVCRSDTARPGGA